MTPSIYVSGDSGGNGSRWHDRDNDNDDDDEDDDDDNDNDDDEYDGGDDENNLFLRTLGLRF